MPGETKPDLSNDLGLSRRAFLRGGSVLGLGMLSSVACKSTTQPLPPAGPDDPFGELLDPDANGLRLPKGFISRIVAVSTQPPVASSSYLWHTRPDGGATFPTQDGGWLYVSNSENSGGAGGVGVLRFAPDGTVTDAYSILGGTTRNCAGGPTPWGTWLSCEEFAGGRVWECDPHTPSSQGVLRPALGTFCHEAAAVDPVQGHVYLTEDEPDGLLYRFIPNSYPDLGGGVLEAAEILDPDGAGAIQPGQLRPLAWNPVTRADPPNGGRPLAEKPADRPTRLQAVAATPFNGGEGCWYESGVVYFATKGDNRVWAIHTTTDQIEIHYDRATATNPELSGVDNVYVTPAGDVLVAEDGGDMQIVALTTDGQVKPILQIVGQSSSEITGPALSPDGRRLYFSSQRGPTPSGNVGVTYEVSGPFPTKMSSGLGGLMLPLGFAAMALVRFRNRAC